MKPLLVIAVAVLMQAAQTGEVDVEKYLTRVEKGEADAVRAELPSLLSRSPNNPDVIYLQGVLTTDGTEAVRIYQSIVDNFPRSQWADAALFKVYQFYYAIGLYRTAEIKLAQLKKEYPTSKYITGIAPSDTRAIAEEPQGKDVPQGTQSIQEPPASSDKPGVADRQPSPPAVSSAPQYALQVGAYSQQVNAEKQKLFFEDLGYPVEVINKVRDARSLFVVLVGEYRSAEDARTKGDEIRKKYNINSMVVTK